MADFIALLRAQPKCFGNPRFILGNPLNDEPYGYCCTDGRRAFLAINNCTWEDRSLPLELNSAWGLPDGQHWDLYRWYPEPARLKGDAESFGPKAAIMLKPFEVVLLEVVPAGQKPSLDRSFSAQPMPTAFAEPSRTVELTVRDANAAIGRKTSAIWTVLTPSSAVSKGGATLTKQADGSILASGKNPSPDTYTITADTKLTGITGIRLEVLDDPQLPSHGPGRAYNGNFALSEFSVTAAPKGNPTALPKPIRLAQAVRQFLAGEFWRMADRGRHRRRSENGMVDRSARRRIADGGFRNGEAGGLCRGRHVDLSRSIKAIRPESADHTLGRFRLSATTAKPPLPPPAAKGTQRFAIQAESPATARGGTFVIAAELKKGPKPFRSAISARTFPAKRNWPANRCLASPCWARAPIRVPGRRGGSPCSLRPPAQPMDLSVSVAVPADVKCQFQGHFIPNKR